MMAEKTRSFEMPLLGRTRLDFGAENHDIVLSGSVPGDLELFQDHFPDFPVLPGVMGLEILKKSIEFFYQDFSGKEAPGRPGLNEISQVRFSAFLRPGSVWTGFLDAAPREADGKTTWKGRLLLEGKTAVSARLKYHFDREVRKRNE